jgi:hypothetical protein
MTQNILSAMSSDEVNSISDTTESMQVAQIIKNKYYDITARGDLPEHKELFQLDPATDSSTPTMMFVPDGVSKIESIRYFNTNTGMLGQTFGHGVNTDLPANDVGWDATSTTSVTVGTGSKVFTINDDMLQITVGDFMVATAGPSLMYGTVTDYTDYTLTVNITTKIGAGTYNSWMIYQNTNGAAPPGYQEVVILPVEQFLDHVNKFNPTENTVSSFVFTDSYNNIDNNFTFYYKTNQQPQFCTVISNYWVIFDCYDATQDVTIQASKTECWGQVIPEFTMADDFYPDLDDQQFALLLNEAKSLAFFELKQQTHAKADQEIKRQWSVVQKNKSVVNRPTYFDQIPDFGRRGSYGHSLSIIKPNRP